MHYIASKTRYTIPSNLKIGDTLELGSSQLYRLIGEDLTLKGKQLWVWESDCKGCGNRYIWKCPKLSVSSVTRTCESHRRKVAYKIRERIKALKINPVVSESDKYPPSFYNLPTNLQKEYELFYKDKVFDKKAYLAHKQAEWNAKSNDISDII